MRAVILLPILLSLLGCSLLWRGPDRPAARALACADFAALAGAVVDGRQRGQSRREQRLLAARGSPVANAHLGYVDAIYDWPRPIDPPGWEELRRTAVAAAAANCANAPVRLLQGGR